MIVYTNKKGELITLSNKEIKSKIKEKLNIADDRQFRKKYDIFKLKLRTYEKLFNKEKRKSVINEFYYYATKRNSEKNQYIDKMSAYNYKTIKKINENSSIFKRVKSSVSSNVEFRFKKFIETSKVAKEIFERFKDNPYLQLYHLDKYSKQIKKSNGGSGDLETNESINYEEIYNYDAYL